jgi:hypothetical protein
LRMTHGRDDRATFSNCISTQSNVLASSALIARIISCDAESEVSAK